MPGSVNAVEARRTPMGRWTRRTSSCSSKAFKYKALATCLADHFRGPVRAGRSLVAATVALAQRRQSHRCRRRGRLHAIPAIVSP